MSTITEIAASLTLKQYVMLYIGCFVLAIIIASVGGKKSRSFRESLISLLALFGGMLAVGYVAVRLEKNIGLLILLVLAFFSGLIGFPAAMIAGSDDKNDSGKSEPAKPAGKPVSVPAVSDKREKKLMEQAGRLKVTDVSSINDDALLGAYVRLHKSSGLGYPALKRIRDEEELLRIAKDYLVDRKLRIYALEHIQSDDKLAGLVRKYHKEWLGQEAYHHITSQKVRYSLCQEFPDLYSCTGFSDPAILRDILEKHKYPDDSMDPFPDTQFRIGSSEKAVSYHKAELYISVLRSGDPELIGMLDKDECLKLTESCINAADTHWADTALRYLKIIYHAGVCESLRSTIEAMHGKTFHHVNEINYYQERDYNPGVVFDLYSRE